MISNAGCGALRAAGAVALSILAASFFTAAGANAQVSPPIGVQSGSPGVAMPALPPPIIPPKETPRQSPADNAPLATSQAGCQADIGKLQSRRMAVLQALNAIAKKNKGKLDPIAACPKFRSLVSIETQFQNYLTENKDWCGIPGQVVDTVKQSTARDRATSIKACQLAARFKKAQALAAQGGGAPQAPRLPAGPL